MAITHIRENKAQSYYFLIAILIIGSIGVWLTPIVFGKFNPSKFSINLTTYYTSIVVAGCMDFILKKVDSDSSNSKSQILKALFWLLIVIFWIWLTIELSSKNHIVLPLILSILGTLLSYSLWWHNNLDNPNFSEKIRTEGRKKHSNNW